ncbi:small ribosomal subunit protein mS25 isoform X2 [Peromyscus maniculatus bairdii]|uniref:small ribosomal subunit protein mS25 isoform X2 n=1 Tax=Peromyscus maniculatus bairdii TaxID=230844 RepID=UPI0010A1D4FB|nr:28S ribosomal protein S25, mitochondrial isoform X2 [Peromyscus maniculatus bairdii]
MSPNAYRTASVGDTPILSVFPHFSGGRSLLQSVTSPGLSPWKRKFVFFNIPQIQYKNPWVQIMLFKNMTPSPFLRFYLDSGEQVLVDVETKSNKEIMEHIKKILGKKEETLREEELEKQRQSHPANFGPRKYCLRECMCEVEGQVPCPGLVPLPKEMTGKYKAALKAST